MRTKKGMAVDALYLAFCHDGIRRFNPLFSLLHSATIPRDRKGEPLHNLVFELDVLDVYDQRLVRRIEVKGFELKRMLGADAISTCKTSL